MKVFEKNTNVTVDPKRNKTNENTVKITKEKRAFLNSVPEIIRLIGLISTRPKNCKSLGA